MGVDGDPSIYEWSLGHASTIDHECSRALSRLLLRLDVLYGAL